MLEERAWRDRNGLDDLAWNPDAVSPPAKGGVYEREAPERSSWWLVLAGVCFVAAALLAVKL